LLCFKQSSVVLGPQHTQTVDNDDNQNKSAQQLVVVLGDGLDHILHGGRDIHNQQQMKTEVEVLELETEDIEEDM
jgi:hypothetical protein